MIYNYITIAIRNLLKFKIFSLINISGLAIGIASCLVIFLYVQNETTHDLFHENSKNIYRLNLKFHIGTNQFDVANGPGPAARAMLEDFPEVVNSVKIFQGNFSGQQTFVRYNGQEYPEDKFYWVDSSFAEIFTVESVYGNPINAINKPNTVMITEAIAQKYFGDEAAIGKMLETGDGRLYKVTAVVKAFPENSHFHFDFLANFQSIEDIRPWDWFDIAVYTYVLLEKNADPAALNAKLGDFSKKYVEPVVTRAMGVSWEEFEKAGNIFGFFLEPLEEIHLTQGIENEFEPVGNLKTIYIFTAIAIIILLVACINFINMATARSTLRATEVGVRKVSGSSQSQLIRQFLVESILLCYVAIVFGLILVELCLPVFNDIIGKNLSTALFSPLFYLFVFVIGGTCLGILAGFYPAFAVSSFNIVSVLKGTVMGTGKDGMRNALVIFQFAISIILFIGTIVIHQQLYYLKNKDLGFDKDHIIVLKSTMKLEKKQKTFKDRVVGLPNISAASYSDCLPQMALEAKVFNKVSKPNESHTLITITADEDFLETYGMELAEGRFFSKDRGADTAAVLLNEAAVRALDIQNKSEEKLVLMSRRRRTFDIIGIYKNFHIEPLHSTIRPLAALLIPENRGRLLSVRVKPHHISETLAMLEKTWKEFLPDQPFEYTFYDEHFADYYKADIQSGKVMSAFAGLAIIIACLGMLGLSSYMVGRRTKEIGIRKVLGARILTIVYMLCKDLLKWVVLANIFAWPIAWYAMNKWLNNFAYRAEIAWWIFIVAAVLALLVAFSTVSFQAIRAASSNPVHALKYE